MLAPHLILDLYLTICAIDFWIRMPDGERNNERDSPILFIFLTTVLLPWTILKAVLCTKIFQLSANILKTKYFKICIGQWIFNNICFVL